MSYTRKQSGIWDLVYSEQYERPLFEFNDRDVSGYLFIITSNESFAWMKGALYKFLEQYE